MKKLIFILVVSIIYAACTGTTTATNESAQSKAAVSFPFTPAYSSNFSIGNDSDALVVLNSYKAWESGDMEALKNTLADSFYLDFPDGGKFMGTRDSAAKVAAQFRDSLSKVELRVDGWVPLHSNDKNEDWVSVWYKEIGTYKNGKIDSAYFQEDNLVKNGKIVFVGSHKQVLK